MPAKDRTSTAASDSDFDHEVHRIARVILAAALVALGIWIARSYLLSFAWAILIATATWPLYARFAKLAANRAWRIIGPILFTLIVSLLVLGPLTLIGIGIGRETRSAIAWISKAQNKGVEPPAWVEKIPVLGENVEQWWREHLSDPGQAKELLKGADAGTLATISKDVGVQVADHLVHILITFMTLFFLYLDGRWIAGRVIALAARYLGESGRCLVAHLAMAVRGVVNGLVLNAVGVGSLITVGYLVAGVPYPLHFGALTVVLALIPLGAWLAIGTASLVLLTQGGSSLYAAGLFGFGAAIMLISDNVTQPVLVGGAAELPFLAVLIGILGGLETFGLIGLFLGPVCMAGLLFVWREWIDDARGERAARE